VASVVAMSHSVLVETARRFVGAFYQALAAGKRVDDAMLEGQRQLKDDTFRGRVFGEGELRLEDWFVPVLFQEKDDPQLFKTTPAKQTVEDFKTAFAARRGELPPEPETGFIGRSRELLALERLMRSGVGFQPAKGGGKLEEYSTYAVIRGQGGEGKTALAAEFARTRCAALRSFPSRRTAMCLRCSMPLAASLWGRTTQWPRSTIWKRPSCPSSALWSSRQRCWWWTTWRASWNRHTK
jgi:hypothetical protein